MNAAVAITLRILLNLQVLFTVGCHRRVQSTLPPERQDQRRVKLALLIQFNGLCAAGYSFLLPSFVATNDPLQQCVLRIVAFFYGCKILDLALMKAHHPPALRTANGAAEETMHSWQDVGRYALLLFSEMRYHSFDIAIEQKERPSHGHQKRDIAYPFLALCGLIAFDFLVPTPVSPELKCICLLLLLQVGFETLHSLVHPVCEFPLFYQPFSAASASAFWATRWHAGAASFLHSLGYRPAKLIGSQWLDREGGRALGVLATFNLTGIWHGWASAALVRDEYSTKLGLQVWAFFMLQGVLCVIERVIWKDRQGAMAQRVPVWAVSIGAAGQCLRSLQSNARVPAMSR